LIWPPPDEVLVGTIVRLEPIREAHRPGLLAASRDERIWTWIDRRVPDSEAGFDAWFDARLRVSGEGAEWCYVTCCADGGEPIGSSSLLGPRPEHDGVEIGWTWLRPEAWRGGANTEAKLLMLELAFERLGCQRVEFKTDARNERSRAALAALPAQFEGIFRKHMLVPVVGVRDSAYFAIVDDDWPRVRGRLRARVAARGEVRARA